MEPVISQQSAENAEYVRGLLRHKQPRFSAALELAVLVMEGDQRPPHRHSGFARDFATADGGTVMVAAFTARQFADLAQTTGRAGTFAFLERVLYADFSATDDLQTHRETIAALLASWFARRTVAELAAEFAGTSVPWARLHNLAAGQPNRTARRRYKDGTATRTTPGSLVHPGM